MVALCAWIFYVALLIWLYAMLCAAKHDDDGPED